jgi:hypothetical protein
MKNGTTLEIELSLHIWRGTKRDRLLKTLLVGKCDRLVKTLGSEVRSRAFLNGITRQG